MLWLATQRNVWKISVEVKHMTVKRKKNSTFWGGRSITVAFSLCLLAVIAMIGMYTVGKTDQKEQEQEKGIEKVQEQAKTETKESIKAEIEEPEEEPEEEQKQEAASGSATREIEPAATDGAAANRKTILDAELESEFEEEVADVTEDLVIYEEPEALEAEILAEEPTLSFSPDADKLLWPIAGNIILDYSMDKSIYFATLDQYKYNPALIIQGAENESVMCSAQGRVESIETLEETGTTVTMDIGDGYQLIYGQLKELAVKEGDYIKAGETIGYISQPTRYYSKEGCNIYFEIQKDGESIDPMPLLQ